ncbi:hypothetical protein NPS70_18095 [Streptomyces sp. C10-9-1]|uniref:hypothetical protein n=1 Tax=Streptomyces sp. C10-9-1 TaxID=1859285 RepID=UPI00211133B1|nr:hypothetical protein [Streptomyces sp. C10-9-1]MCQ6555087.1 hypothetical protein [Streptomyces sp. C10-9-1]
MARKPLVALVSAADLERLDTLEAAAAVEEERPVRPVSSPDAVADASGGRDGFGLTAEHRGPEGPRG